MATKISNAPSLTPIGTEYILVVKQDAAGKWGWFKTTLSSIAALTPAPTKTSLGLDRVDNTSDDEKPISQLVAEALANKSASNHRHAIEHTNGLIEALAGFAEKNHTHNLSESPDLIEALQQKADSEHSHSSYVTMDQLAAVITEMMAVSGFVTQAQLAQAINVVDDKNVDGNVAQW